MRPAKLHYSFDQTSSVDPVNWYWFEHGFSKEELEKIYKDVGEIAFRDADIIGGSAPTSIRSSRIKWIPQTPQWKWLYDKLMDYAAQANNDLWHFDLISAPEQIQYTEYYASENGHYDWHMDVGPGIASGRKVSLTVQLSDFDEYEGGDLELWLGADAIHKAPRGAGNVVIFPSYMMHRVKQVTSGTRRSFVLWVGGTHYR